LLRRGRCGFVARDDWLCSRAVDGAGDRRRDRCWFIPSKATFTVNLRNSDEGRLRPEEEALAYFLEKLAADERLSVTTERLARFEPVTFDSGIVDLIEGYRTGPDIAANDIRRWP